MPGPKGPFPYTYQWWDKSRPTVLPSTGLGAALKTYQAAKKTLGDRPLVKNYFAATAALAKVEELREKVIRKLGLPDKPLKKILEDADGAAERRELVALAEDKFERVAEKAEADLRTMLERNKNSIARCQERLEALEKGADPVQVKLAAEKIIGEGTSTGTSFSSLGDEYEDMERAKNVLPKDFPILGPLLGEAAGLKTKIQAERATFLGLLRELTAAVTQ
jgi:hypothetical protein